MEIARADNVSIGVYKELAHSYMMSRGSYVVTSDRIVAKRTAHGSLLPSRIHVHFSDLAKTAEVVNSAKLVAYSVVSLCLCGIRRSSSMPRRYLSSWTDPRCVRGSLPTHARVALSPFPSASALPAFDACVPRAATLRILPRCTTWRQSTEMDVRSGAFVVSLSQVRSCAACSPVPVASPAQRVARYSLSRH